MRSTGAVVAADEAGDAAEGGAYKPAATNQKNAADAATTIDLRSLPNIFVIAIIIGRRSMGRSTTFARDPDLQIL